MPPELRGLVVGRSSLVPILMGISQSLSGWDQPGVVLHTRNRKLVVDSHALSSDDVIRDYAATIGMTLDF
jgi:hypothetical protein